MANKTPIISGNFNTAGNWWGSVSLVGCTANLSTVTYLTASTTTILTPNFAANLPGCFMVQPNGALTSVLTTIEFSRDGGTTWTDFSVLASGSYMFLDGSANWRLRNTTATAQGLLFTPFRGL